MKQFVIIFNLFIAFSFAANAARIDSISIESKSMKTGVKALVIIPDVALTAQSCPVIYLLHGYSGNEKQWIGIKPNLPQIADKEGIIFVCPDGKNSWYLDSPLDTTSQYETFISYEMIEYIDSHYKTLADRKHRAITGLSMGGHGAMFNAFRHKDVFGAAGSMSGAIDIRQRDNNYGLVHLLGDISKNRQNWEANSVLNQLNSLSSGDLAICFDCGINDFCFKYNEDLNDALVKKNIAHDYTVRPGEHNAAYWKNAIDYQILFFSKFFQKH
ncbi:MAG: esterase family protein [Dysgonamonadaceae bacterium]|nr:esterase family protein [Dysgonamonadaceae bacterium]